MKKLYVFDLDGTLAESKAPLEADMGELICALLEEHEVAVMSGAKLEQFKEQFLAHLPCKGDEHISHLCLLPTSGASLYQCEKGGLTMIYENKLDDAAKEKIRAALKEALTEVGFEQPEKLYGDQLEDRMTQMTFSALGQQAPLAEKVKWDPDRKKRTPLQTALVPKLPEFEVRIGGSTTIDITQKGIDKAYGVRELLKHLNLPITEAVYIGDALFAGGNDSAVIPTGIETISVTDPSATKEYIKKIITGALA
jgi:HAD superfamily hydrolase (TIGR01484 family)